MCTLGCHVKCESSEFHIMSFVSGSFHVDVNTTWSRQPVPKMYFSANAVNICTFSSLCTLIRLTLYLACMLLAKCSRQLIWRLFLASKEFNVITISWHRASSSLSNIAGIFTDSMAAGWRFMWCGFSSQLILEFSVMIWYDTTELTDRPLFKENDMSHDYVSCERCCLT